MNVPFVDLSRQLEPLLADIQAAISSVIERCAFVNGPEIKEFEKRMAQWLNTSEVCTVSNCTHAIFLTLKALGIGEGDGRGGAIGLVLRVARGQRRGRAGRLRLGRGILRPAGVSEHRAGDDGLAGRADLGRDHGAFPGGRGDERQSAGPAR